MKAYADFDLQIERSGETYRARVLHSPAGNGATDFDPPFSPEELERLIPLFAGSSRDLDPPRGTSEETAFREAGTKLFQSVFSGQVLNRLQLSLAKVATQKMGLRLRLRLSHPEVALWPWEYLYDPDGRKWLALLPNLAIVRYPEVEAPIPALSVSPPLRILVVIAGPRGRLPLDAEREWRLIQSSLQSARRRGAVVLDRLESGTLQCLQDRLERSRFHVLHFIGHGSHGPEGGLLLFEGQQGDAHPVSGRFLGSVLHSHSSLRLVVLNSCDGATEGEDDFSSVADTLVRNDIPSIIAMRAPVSNQAAASFARRFYPVLARGRPLEEAMMRTRQRMVGDENQVEWGTPVLYLRAANGDFVRPRRWPIYGGIAALLLLLGLSTIPFFLSKGRVSQEPILTRSSALAITKTDPRCPRPPGIHIPFRLIQPEPDGNEVTPGLEPFCIGAFEVTQEQWERVVGGDHESDHPGPDRPVERVSLEQAREFARRLNRLDPEGGYRLPRDLEWSYAAGPKKLDFTLMTIYGNCTRKGDAYERTAPVGQFEPNDFGLYDIAGNVMEWVEDGARPGKALRRGGAWNSSSKNCGLSGNEEVDSSSISNFTGFRIARDPLPASPK